MSKFADYYTYSPLAAMRTGRQPPCPISRRHDTLPSPQCPISRRHETPPSTQCPISRRHETLPAPNALSAGGMTRCPAPREGIRRGVGQDTRENSISLNQYKRNINEYP